MPIGMPSRMRLSAPTDGFIWLDSISEIVELVTPERLASSRCDILLRARTKRNRSPTSMLIVASGVGVRCRVCCGSNECYPTSPANSMAWMVSEKDLLHIINMMSGGETAKERAHDDSPDS